MDKPVSLQIEDARKNIVDSINAQNLNVTILDMLIRDIYNEIHALAIRQYEKDKADYEKNSSVKPAEGAE